jgi:hypothetical protein
MKSIRENGKKSKDFIVVGEFRRAKKGKESFPKSPHD